MASGDTKTEALLNVLGNGGSYEGISGCGNTKTQNYIIDAINRVEAVEQEVEDLKNNPDVVDIVATYADLQAYDKSTLTDKDIIRVMADETHDGKSTFYRYNKSTNSFDFVSEISGGGDIVYSTKTTSNSPDGGAVYIGNINASQQVQLDPTSTDQHEKYFWALPFDPSGHYYDNATIPGNETVNIGGYVTGGLKMNSGTVAIGFRNELGPSASTSVVIGYQAHDIGFGNSITMGNGATTTAGSGVAIGRGSSLSHNGSVALGAYSHTSSMGEVNIGTTNASYGYNSTNYRILTGVHNPVDAHDAATKGYVDSRSSATHFYCESSLSDGAQLYSDAAMTTPVTSQAIANAYLNEGAIITAVGGTYPTEYWEAFHYTIIGVEDWKEDRVLTPWFLDSSVQRWSIGDDGKIHNN